MSISEETTAAWKSSANDSLTSGGGAGSRAGCCEVLPPAVALTAQVEEEVTVQVVVQVAEQVAEQVTEQVAAFVAQLVHQTLRRQSRP